MEQGLPSAAQGQPSHDSLKVSQPGHSRKVEFYSQFRTKTPRDRQTVPHNVALKVLGTAGWAGLHSHLLADSAGGGCRPQAGCSILGPRHSLGSGLRALLGRAPRVLAASPAAS